VRINDLAVQYASEKLQDNKEVGLAACFQNNGAIYYLSNKLQNSPQFKNELDKKRDKWFENFNQET